MGARGPAPLPDNVRTLRGNPGKRPAPQRLKLPPKAPSPPTWLRPEAKAEWKRVVPGLIRMGVLAEVDRSVLTAYCSTWAVYVEAERKLRAEGLVGGARSDRPTKNPVWQIWRESNSLMIALRAQLYLTPTARLRSELPEGAAGGSSDEEASDILD